MKHLIKSILFIIIFLSLDKETTGHYSSCIELEIQNEYEKFTGCTIPDLRNQPCLAVQFVYSLQEKLKNTHDKNIAEKIALIIGRGVGVGGISERQATDEEHKLLFSALYQVASYKIEEECYSFSPLSANIRGTFYTKSDLYKVEVNQLINISISKVVREDKLEVSSLNFLKDQNSYERLLESVTYKFCGLPVSSPSYIIEVCNKLGFNNETSFNQCLVLAKKGKPKAQYLVSNFYGLKDNKDKCLSWCKLSAENGYIPAQICLAVFYKAGCCVKGNQDMYLKWLTLAAEQGDLDSQYELAEEYYNNRINENFSLAAKWYRCCAERGLSKAQKILVTMYQQGLGVPKNENEATKWQDMYDENDSDEYEYSKYSISSGKSIF